MKILYIFPHPDDESFGPALAISRQKREGHQVHLLTLTRGGATRQREKLGLSVEEMGSIRFEEMRRMAEVVGLDSLEVLDFPDGGLAQLNPLKLERVLGDHLRDLRPSVIVTYPWHGISGHPDHLTTHAVVKRVFAAERITGKGTELRRLAFFTLLPTGDCAPKELSVSAEEDVDCLIAVDDADVERAESALASYSTYEEVIREHDPLGRVGRRVAFEIFLERHEPRLGSLTEKIESR
ncbi:MAG TPA: PIG-L family deacetylase [Thermoanaerobaculia bacterium]|nr:PIG-L family deacetylase [Thermoanaerobaculia bacterium]